MKHAAACLMLMLLTGCGTMPPLFGIDEERQASELLAYSQRVALAGADEQRRELAAAGQAFSRERTPQARLRLALLLAQPGSAVNDDARAATLLEPFVSPGSSAGGAGPVRQLGALLHAQVAERLKEQRRSQQMKEQLDALRAVERSLIDRAQPKPR